MPKWTASPAPLRDFHALSGGEKTRVALAGVLAMRPSLHENVDYTPYEGLELQGWVHATYLRGRLIASADGNLPPQPPTGCFIPAQ